MIKCQTAILASIVKITIIEAIARTEIVALNRDLCMQYSPAELIIKRNDFYQRNFRRMLKIVFALLLMFILLLSFVFYQDRTLKPMPRYFPTTPDGRLIETPAVNINHFKTTKPTSFATNR